MENTKQSWIHGTGWVDDTETNWRYSENGDLHRHEGKRGWVLVGHGFGSMVMAKLFAESGRITDGEAKALMAKVARKLVGKKHPDVDIVVDALAAVGASMEAPAYMPFVLKFHDVDETKDVSPPVVFRATNVRAAEKHRRKYCRAMLLSPATVRVESAVLPF